MFQEYSNPPTNNICPQTPNVQIYMFNAEEAFKRLNSNDHEVKLDHLPMIEIGIKVLEDDWNER
jgi:hypothetical protein